MNKSENRQTYANKIYSPDVFNIRPNTWSGKALDIGGWVLRTRYRTNEGHVINLALPNNMHYEIRYYHNDELGQYGAFVSGQCDGEPVIVQVYIDEIWYAYTGDEPEQTLATHLIVMPPSVENEMMERFRTIEEASIEDLEPWREWVARMARYSLIYEKDQYLARKFAYRDPVDVTNVGAIVTFVECKSDATS
ncbi:hypothetical protein [Brevundimonas sp. DC300-4]|uniref:hypothetical protein n=1 Tax=Brevundimonas sp. DC300-4 TaxID=2804594 RepID=UPI003CECDDFD